MNKNKIIIPNGKEALEVLVMKGPFHRNIANLKNASFQPATTEEFTEAYNLEQNAWDYENKPYINLVNAGCWVAEGLIILPNGDELVTSRDYNPLLKNAKEATLSECYGNYAPVDRRQLETLMARAQEDPKKAIKSGVLYVPLNTISYKTNDEGWSAKIEWDHPLARFLLRKQNELLPLPVYVSSCFTPDSPVCLALHCHSGHVNVNNPKPAFIIKWGKTPLYTHNRVCGIQRVPEEQASPLLKTAFDERRLRRLKLLKEYVLDLIERRKLTQSPSDPYMRECLIEELRIPGTEIPKVEKLLEELEKEDEIKEARERIRSCMTGD